MAVKVVVRTEAETKALERYQAEINDMRKQVTASSSSVAQFTKDMRKLDSQQRALNKVTNQTATDFKKLAASAASAGRAMSMSVTLPLVAVGAAATKMAMDAVESENLFTVSMGNMAQSARSWSEELSKSLGLNSYEIRKNVGTFNVMLTSMGAGKEQAYGMAKGLTQLSYDMASFYNLKPEEAFQKLQSGISGEIEPLKRLGIVVNETTVKAWAYKNGVAAVGSELTEAQKIQARYGVIMEQTSKAQGDLARTIDSPANKLRILRSRTQETAIEFGQVLVPILEDLVSVAERAVKAFGGMSDGQKKATVYIAGLAAATGPVLIGLGSVINAYRTVMAWSEAAKAKQVADALEVGAAQNGAAGAIGMRGVGLLKTAGIVGGIAAVTAGITNLVKPGGGIDQWIAKDRELHSTTIQLTEAQQREAYSIENIRRQSVGLHQDIKNTTIGTQNYRETVDHLITSHAAVPTAVNASTDAVNTNTTATAAADEQTKKLAEDTRSLAQAELDALSAGESIARAREDLAAVTKKYGANSLNARVARLKLTVAEEAARAEAAKLAAKIKQIREEQAKLAKDKALANEAGRWKIVADEAERALKAAQAYGKSKPQQAADARSAGFEAYYKSKGKTSSSGSTTGKSLSGLDKNFATAIQGLAEAYKQATGKKLTITSAFRTYADQKRIWDSGIRPAARPGTSRHEKGAAVDVSSRSDFKVLERLAPLFGLANPIKGDRIHFQWASSSSYSTSVPTTKKSTGKTATQLAAEAKAKAKRVMEDLDSDIKDKLKSISEKYKANNEKLKEQLISLNQEAAEKVQDLWGKYWSEFENRVESIRNAFGGIFGKVSEDTTLKDMAADIQTAVQGVRDLQAALEDVRKSAFDSEQAVQSEADADIARMQKRITQLKAQGRQYLSLGMISEYTQAKDEAARIEIDIDARRAEAAKAVADAKVQGAERIKTAEEALAKAQSEQAALEKKRADEQFARSGKGLLANLVGQRDALASWQKDMSDLGAKLKTRGFGDLAESLWAEGPEAADKIKGLLELSNEDLSTFGTTWKEMGDIAGTAATSGLEKFKQDTEDAVKAVNEMVRTRTQEYVDAWTTANAKIADDAKLAFEKIEDAAKKAIDSIKNLPKAVEDADLVGIAKGIDSATAKSAQPMTITLNIPITIDGNTETKVIEVTSKDVKTGTFEVRLGMAS